MKNINSSCIVLQSLRVGSPYIIVLCNILIIPTITDFKMLKSLKTYNKPKMRAFHATFEYHFSPLFNLIPRNFFQVDINQ